VAGTDIQFKNLRAEVPILGFTGALGSGCTFLAERLAKRHNYRYFSLSQVIRDTARRNKLGEQVSRLQNIGNLFRSTHGNDVLVRLALDDIDKAWPRGGAVPPAGIVLDSIRNAGEVRALHQFPNFYLFSIQADRDLRKQRLLKAGRFRDEADFDRADRRDEEEKMAYGQQVRLCNDLADIVIMNNEQISESRSSAREDRVEDKLYKRYVRRIESIAEGRPDPETRPLPDEALMTAAYCESKRSSCVKRRVGAVIARANGEVIAAAHNEVPEGALPCLEDPEYEWCARDITAERLAAKMEYCPKCGAKVALDVTCLNCQTKIERFAMRCPNPNCHKELDIQYNCPECKTKVFEEFVPGKSDQTGRLLDLCRALHAEENAILSLSRTGRPCPEDAVLYTTTFPCDLCANKIIAVGIKEVVYSEPYPMRRAKELFEANEVKMRAFEGVKSRAYFRLYA
jgi:deoxycytidylate deaminase